ncbi:MAG: DUF4397 domain-containing protein [Chloroflexi bacterium]|nr:DUF4397 domain-containing protein [Chloroflexota bacterium]
MPKTLFVRFTVFGLLALLLAGLLPVVAQTDVTQVNLANLRVVNALVGIGPVDVYLDGERIAYALAPEAATAYFSIPAGRHILAVRLPEAEPLSVPVADLLVDLSPNQSETAVVYQKQFATEGFVPTLQQAGAIFILDDDRSLTPLGKTRMTAVHLAVGTPGRLSVAYPSRESLLHEVALEKPFGTIDIAARVYSLAVVAADSPDLAVLSRLGDYSFYANTLYTIIIVPDVRPVVSSGGQPQIGPVSATPRAFVVSAPIEPPPGGIRLRVVHAAHNTAVLDVYVDGRLVAERVNYSRATEYLGLQDYSHVVSLRLSGEGGAEAPPLAEWQFEITPENRQQANWTLMLVNAGQEDTSAALPVTQPGPTGEAEQATIISAVNGDLFMVLLPDNIAQTRRGYARVRLINAVNDIQPLRLLAQNVPPLPAPPGVTPSPTPEPPANATPIPPQQLVEDVVFAAEANESEVPVGLYSELEFIPAGTTNALALLENVQLVGGMVYTFVAMGSPIGNPPISVVTFEDFGVGLPLDRLYLGLITAESANIRTGPSTASGILRQLSINTEVEVLGRNLNGEWIRIRFTDPDTGNVREGWISATANILSVTRLGVPVNVLALPRYVVPEN